MWYGGHDARSHGFIHRYEHHAEGSGKFSEKSLRVVKAIEDGDHVAVFSAVCHEPGASEFAVVHIVRFDDDRIAELWDVAQEAPKDSPNELGMF